ncbi:MAG: hypothetical protein ACTSQ5_03900 [Promethearchaeota archaeon]
MSDNEEKDIQVQCPVCQKNQMIKVPNYIFDNKKVGNIKIQIYKGICCEHQFILFLNKKGDIRGYETIDMNIDLSEVEASRSKDKIYIRDMLKTYGDYAVSCVIHSLLLNIPIIILRTKYEGSRASEFTSLFNKLLPDSPNKKILLVSNILEMEYQKAKIEDALVINPTGIVINTPWKDMQLDFETKVVHKSLEIIDGSTQTYIIQDAVAGLFKEAEFIKAIIDKGDIIEDDIKRKIAFNFSHELSNKQLDLLKQILEHRYKSNVKRIKNRLLSKLDNGLW